MKKPKTTSSGPTRTAAQSPAGEPLRGSSAFSPQQTVLLAVTGESPAILTETVWCLAHETPPVIPDLVIALTTSRGVEVIRQQLFAPHPDFGGNTIWESSRAALVLQGHSVQGRLVLEPRVIVSRRAEPGRAVELPDIRTRDDNTAAADFILETVRSQALSRDGRVIASVAGGRKTMSALLYACMTLVGKETDRLTHVLVNDPYDLPLTPRFFYPEQPAQELRTREGRTVLAAKAQIQMADVLFVALRNRFRDLADQKATFTRLVARYNDQFRAELQHVPEVVLNFTQESVSVDGQSTHFATHYLLVLELLFRAHESGLVPRDHVEVVEWLRAYHGFPAAKEFTSESSLAKVASFPRSAVAVIPKDEWFTSTVSQDYVKKAPSDLRIWLRRIGSLFDLPESGKPWPAFKLNVLR